MALVTERREKSAAIITFANPPRGYMNAAQVSELGVLIENIETDASVRTVIFTGGVPGVFIRHYDVGDILEAAGAVRKSGLDGDALMEAGKRGNPISQLFDKIDRLSKPTIAAINGYCQGGGFEFALCCDIRVAEEGDYRIGLPETNVGIFPGAGGTQRLPRVIGEAKALALILKGETLPPQEAANVGLVHEFVPVGGALTRALELAENFTAKTPRALAEAKHLVKQAARGPLPEGCAEERGRFSRLLLEDDEALRLMQNFQNGNQDINKA